jgi:hypothetical protein
VTRVVRSRGALIAAGLLAACGPAPATAPPFEMLPLAADTLVAPWASLPTAAWLGGDRWVLVGSDWNAAAIADFSDKTLDPLGGPAQRAYLNPASVLAVADTILLADWGRRRTTVWTGEGRLIDSIPWPDALRGSAPRGRDGAGQLYFEVRPIPQRDGSGNRDSAAIVRAPRDLSRFDTVARLAPVDVREMRRENSSRFERQVFSGDDLWGVWRDGTVWIARLLRNQIESIETSGRVTKGPELPDPVYEVTQADRLRYLQGFPEGIRPKETDLAWALIFPPFVTAYAGPGETIWLEKSKPVLDSARAIQVLDRAGDLLRVLRMPGNSRLLAVGSESLLFAEQFEQGVRLMQVRIPARVSPAP